MIGGVGLVQFKMHVQLGDRHAAFGMHKGQHFIAGVIIKGVKQPRSFFEDDYIQWQGTH